MRWVRRIALAEIVWCAGLLAASTLLGGIPLPTPIVMSAFLLALPVLGVTVFAARRLEIRETGRAATSGYWLWRLLRETMPGWLLIASLLLFVGFWVVGAFYMGSSVKELGAGTYAVQNHGQWTVISKAQYLHLKAQQQRGFLSVPGGLCVAAAVLSTALLRREARREAVRPKS
ncbi:hypothetical protein GA0070609_6307 [Micromonospora echinaurantiaca]|uniref:Uncharacterized protein n=1 Tax=Micromonospora echinaurantiaca TaxID=47857 RepID=A0A1C5KCC5_9ACTN|nr:hypothetical protein [Micromonospora echinaurantiaca]SCG80209.1 hypothetical protein GA0070609_6307 [Micromonospora echinaurantiaca]